MRRFRLRTALALALSSLAGCEPAAAADPIGSSARASAAQPLAARAGVAPSPQEKAVLDAMAAYKEAVVASDIAALERLWTDAYTFINAQGVLVTRAQRLANFASGATNVAVIDDEREITVRVYGDMAVVQNLSTLRGQFSGQPTDTDLRGTFVWIRRQGRWQLVTNQLTPVVR
jgi:ketosteroid isomerase-like protein